MDCLNSSSSLLSFDSDVYRQLVAGRMVGESAEDTEDDAAFEFCVCRVCRERRNTSINRQTKFYVEFQLHGLDANDQQLRNELVKQCGAANVDGYIIYTYDRRHASGVMEGAIRSINTVKDWLETQTGHIPEPHEENICISWFMVNRNPFGQPFAERVKEPLEGQNSDIGMSE